MQQTDRDREHEKRSSTFSLFFYVPSSLLTLFLLFGRGYFSISIQLDIGTGIHAFLVSSASTWSRYASGNTALRAHRRNHPRSKLNIDEDGENGPQREINFAMDLLSDVTDKAVNSKFLPFLKVSSSGDSTHHSRELKRKSDEEHMKSIDLHMQLSVDEIEISAREPQSGGSVNLISSRASLALGSHPVKPSFPSSRHGSADSKTTATLERSSNRATAPSRSVKYVNFHSDDLKILLLKESSLATDSEPDMAPKKQGSVLCSAETRKLKLNLNMYSPSQPQLPVGKLTENMLPEDHIYCQKSSAVPLTPQTTVILDFDGFYFTLPLHDWASVEPSRFIDAWVRCVDVISIKNNDHSVQRNSGKSESRARYDTPDCTLQQEAQASISICARVKSLSFVIFPLPSVKLTYSIDRIWCSFNDSSHRCKDITISIGKDKKRKKKDKDHGGEMGVEENPISDEEEGVETVPHSFQLHHLNQKNYHCKKVSSSIASSSTSGVPSTQIEEDEGMDLVWELKLPVVRAAFGFRDVTVTDHEVTDAALVNEDAPKKEMVAAVGILTIGRMANHINEDILNRMLQYQSILDTEISQIIDKIKFRLRERSPPNTSESFTPVYNEYGRHTDGSSRTLSQKLSESMIQHGRSADSEHLPSENNRQPNNRSTDARNSGLEWTKDQMKLNLTLVVQEINMTADVSKISPLPRTDSLTSPYPSYSYSSHYSFYPYGTPLNPSASPILSLSSGEVRSTVVLNPTYSLDDRSKCKPLLKRVSLDTESEDLSFPGTDTEDLYFPGTLGNDVKGDDKKHAQDVSNSPLCVELSSEGFTIKTTIPIQGESINIFGRSQFSADRKHNTNAFRNHTLDVADLGGAPLVGDVRWEKVLCFESNVTTRVGTDLDWSNIKGGIFIKESSFRLLAVEATLSSLDVMSSHFQAAYESYVSERARLLRENEISDYIPDFKSNTDHILSQWGTMNLGDDLQGMAVSHNEPVSLSVPEKTIGVGRIKRRRKKKAKRKKKLGGTFQFSLRQARIIVMYANQTPHLFGSVKPKSCTPVERKMSVSENEDDGNNFDAVVCSLDRFGGQVAYLPMPAIDEGKYVLRYVQYYNQQQANGIEATFQADHFSLAFVSRVTDKETVDHICDRISEVSSASKVSHDVNHAFFPCLGVKMQINFKDESIVNDLSSRSAGRSYERVGSAITLSSSHPTAKFRMLTIDTDISAEGAQVHIDPHLVHYLRDIESFVSLCAGFDPPRAQTTSSSAGSTSSAASASSSSSVTSSNSLLAASTETQSQSNLASWNFDSASSSPSFPATKKEKKPWGVNLHLKLAQKSGSCHLHLRQGSDCIFGGGSASEREEGPSSGIASSKAVSHDLEHSSPLPVDAIAEVKARAFADRIGGKSRLLSKNERVGKLEEKIGKVQQKLEPEHLGLSTRKSWLSEKSSQKDASNQSTDLLQQKGQKEESGADDQSRRASSKWIGGDVIKFGLPSMKVGWFFDHTPSLNVYSHPMFDTNNVINLEISLPDLQLSPGVLIFIYQTQEEMAIRSVRALSEDCQLEITAVPSLFYPSAAPDTARVGTDENAKFPILVEHQQSVGNVEGQKGENNLTVTCRVCPTFLKLDCLPMDAGVSLVIKIEEPVIGCYSSSPLSVKGKSMAETRRYVCEALTLSSPHMTVSLNNSIVGSVTNGNMDPSLSSQFIIHGTKLHHVRTYADKTHSKSQSISNGVEDKRQSRFTGGKRLDFKTALFKIDSVLLDLDARSLQSMMVMDTCWNPTASEANLSSSAMIEVGVKSILRNKPISWTELEQSSSQSSKEGSIPTLQNTQSVRGDHAGEGGAQRWSSSPSRKEENSVIYLAFADKMKLNLHLNGVDNNVESLQTTELNRIFLKAVEIDCNNRIGLSPFMSLLTVDRLAMKLTPQHGGLAGNLELRNGIKVKAGRLRYSDEVDEAKSARSTGIIGSSAPTSQSQRKLTFHDCRSEKNLHNILDAEISSLYVNLYTEERQLLLLKTEDASSISIYDEKHRSGQRKNFYDWTVDTTLSLSSEVYLSINDEAIPMSLQLYSDISRYCAHESTKMLVFKRHCQRLCWDPSLMFMEIKELRAVVTALDREQSRKEMKLREKRGRGVANFRTFDVSPNRSPVDTDKKSTSPFAFDPLSGSESQFSSVPVSALEGTVNVEGGVIRLSVLLGDDEKASLEIFNPRIELHRKFMAEDDCVVRTLKMTARGSQDMPQEAVTLYKVQPEYSRRLPLVSVPPFDMGHHTREPDFSLSSSSSSSTFLGANVIQSELKASLGDSHLVVEIDPKMFKEILQDIRTFVKGKDATKLSAPVLAAPPLEFEQSGLLDQRSRMVEAFSLLSSLEGDDCSSMAVSADEVYWVGSLQRIAGLLHMLRVEQCRQNRNQTEKKDQNVNFDRNSKRKIIDKMTHVFDFNPIFSVHKGNGSGMSLNVLLRWFGVEGEDFVVIPEGIHTYLTANLDGLLEAATQASHSTDLWFRKP